MSRRESREMAFKLLFQIEVQKDEIEEQIETFLNEMQANPEEREYIVDVVNGTMKELPNIDIEIGKYLKGWTISRLSKVDLTILRLAMYEIMNRKDIPDSVSINEAVEIAKKYGTDDSGSFVNGVLGEYYKGKTPSSLKGE